MSYETSAIRTQTPGNYPKRNKLRLEHGESLKTRIIQYYFRTSFFGRNFTTTFRLQRTEGEVFITVRNYVWRRVLRQRQSCLFLLREVIWGGSRGVAPLIPSLLEGSGQLRDPPPFPPCLWANISPHLKGCLHLQTMLFKKNFLALLAVLLRHFKPYETSAAVQTYDNCSPFPHTSADLHSHCKAPKPIHLSLVCGLWPVLVAFVGLGLYVYWGVVGACVLVKRRIDMWTARCLERDLFYCFHLNFRYFYLLLFSG